MPSGSEHAWLTAHAHRARLVAIARHRGLDADEAQDVASETILRAACASDLDPARIGAWMSVVAQRLSVDVHRRRPTQSVLARVHHHDSLDRDDVAAVDDREEAQWVASVVALLPEVQKQVLYLTAGGAGAGVIAESTGRSYKSVESCLSRARREVRHALEATFALLAAGAALARRGARLAVPTAAAVCLASAVQLSGPSAHGAAPPDSAGVAAPSLPALSAPRAPGVEGLRPSTTPVRRVAGPSRLATLPGHQAGPVGHSSVEVTRKRGEESVAESALRCLEEGVEVSQERIGCPEPDALSP